MRVAASVISVRAEWIDTHLLKHSDSVGLTPVFGDQAGLDTIDVDAVEPNLGSCWLDVLPDTAMRATRRDPRHNQIILGDHLLDPKLEVGEGAAQALEVSTCQRRPALGFLGVVINVVGVDERSELVETMLVHNDFVVSAHELLASTRHFRRSLIRYRTSRFGAWTCSRGAYPGDTSVRRNAP
jgi:hypothetical protein